MATTPRSDSLFRFRFLRSTRDPSGYYMTRWDKAVAVSVVAPDEPAARKKALAMSGPMYGGRSGDVWAFLLEGVDEVQQEVPDGRE